MVFEISENHVGNIKFHEKFAILMESYG
jgi:hypothetical protein